MLDTLNKTAMLAVLALLSMALLTRLPPSMVDYANDQLQRFHPGWKVPTKAEDFEQWIPKSSDTSKSSDGTTKPSDPKLQPSPSPSPQPNRSKGDSKNGSGKRRTLL